MEIRQSKEHGVTCIALVGRLDELATSGAEHIFTETLESGAEKVLLDLEGVEYVSSSGLRVLLLLSRSMEKTEGALKLCSLSPFVAEVFEISNFTRLFEIHSSHSEAMRAFAIGTSHG